MPVSPNSHAKFCIRLRKALFLDFGPTDEILKDAPQNFIFGADDSVPNDVDQEKLRKIVDYIHTWRQTHNK